MMTSEVLDTHSLAEKDGTGNGLPAERTARIVGRVRVEVKVEVRVEVRVNVRVEVGVKK